MLAHKYFIIIMCVIPCDAELFVSIFPSFKAGIANAISSFKWRKIFILKLYEHYLYT